uniref:SMP-30/Gluconolactonase/LRE-like region domain-containing protein n=1 Tax=Trichuris muris TaxID=70415 RepID=A0A5S6QSX2_TRIMR
MTTAFSENNFPQDFHAAAVKAIFRLFSVVPLESDLSTEYLMEFGEQRKTGPKNGLSLLSFLSHSSQRGRHPFKVRSDVATLLIALANASPHESITQNVRSHGVLSSKQLSLTFVRLAVCRAKRITQMKTVAIALIATAGLAVLLLLGVGLFFALIPRPEPIPDSADELIPTEHSTMEQEVTSVRSLLLDQMHNAGFEWSFGTLQTVSQTAMTSPTIPQRPFKPLSTETEPAEPMDSEDAEVLITPKSYDYETTLNSLAEGDERGIGFIALDSRSSIVNPSSSRVTLHVNQANGTFDSARGLRLAREMDLKRYGKIVGLALRNHILAVASYSYGTVGLIEPDSMHMLAELECEGCNLFDLDIMRSGDVVAVDSKHEKVIKMRTNGERVAERHVHGANKGISVCGNGKIYTLSDVTGSVRILDEYLNHIGKITVPSMDKHQCKYVHCLQDVLFISCNSALFVVNISAERAFTINAPTPGVYGLGISSDATGRIYVAKRGTSSLDVYHSDGRYEKTLSASQQFLWSDVAVSSQNVYAIDYIGSKIVHYIRE